MRYDLLPADYLIERIRRDTAMPDFDLRPDDLREWIAEAIRELEAKGQFEEKRVWISYQNGKAKLPDNWAGYKATDTRFTRHYKELHFANRSGIAIIDYYVYPVDIAGMPMLIDQPNALNYFFWALCEKLAFLGRVPSTFTIQLCEIRKLDYKKLAETDLNWPQPRNGNNFTRKI